MKTLQTNSNKSKNDIVRVKSNVNLGSRIFLRYFAMTEHWWFSRLRQKVVAEFYLRRIYPFQAAS